LYLVTVLSLRAFDSFRMVLQSHQPFLTESLGSSALFPQKFLGQHCIRMLGLSQGRFEIEKVMRACEAIHLGNPVFTQLGF
jgi:hypothetical protein